MASLVRVLRSHQREQVLDYLFSHLRPSLHYQTVGDVISRSLETCKVLHPLSSFYSKHCWVRGGFENKSQGRIGRG
jgi:hypothetical protein